jgi:aminomethyltransferase
MPLRYSGDIEEVTAVRNVAGVFDVSHMGQVELEGPCAAEDIDRLVTNDVRNAEPGRATYTMMCNDAGGVIDDLIVYKFADDRWMIVLNASRADVDTDWIGAHLSSTTAVKSCTPERGIIALQGPRACEILQSLAECDLTGIERLSITTTRVAGIPCTMARTGYTGEDGFELFPDSEKLSVIWDALLETRLSGDGRPIPCGLGARDVCRLEAGLRLYGNDLSEDVTPLEAGLKWTVKFGKPDFIGKAALKRQLANGVPKKTIGLKMLDRSIPRRGYAVIVDDAEVGTVTSGIFSPTLQVGIGLALVKGSVPDEARFSVMIRGSAHPAEVVKPPFVRKER